MGTGINEIVHGADLEQALYSANSDFLPSIGGETIFPRGGLLFAGNAWVSQVLRLQGFRCKRSETVTQATVVCSTLAGATPSLVRYGVYQRQQDKSYNLVASTPNDTTLLAAANTAYPKAFSLPLSKTFGEEYLFGVLVVTAAALPAVYGGNVLSSANVTNFGLSDPIRIGAIAGQADLPTTIAVGTITNANTAHMQALLN